MPYSLDEMRREMDKMASEGFLFHVFPAETVRTNMAVGAVMVSDAEVERLWTAYQKALDAGAAPYAKASGGPIAAPLLKAMGAETGYPRLTVIAFLNGLEKAVKEQGWDWRWLDPRSAKEAGLPLTAGESVKKAVATAGQTAGALVKPTLDPVTNVMKYTAIALVAGAVIYGIYEANKAWNRKKR